MWVILTRKLIPSGLKIFSSPLIFVFLVFGCQPSFSFSIKQIFLSMSDDEIVREGTCVRDVSSQAFIAAFANFLKQSEAVTPPDYTAFTKTATHKENSPLDNDWFYTRCAAIARKVYLKPRGVGQLARAFGGKQRRGVRTNHFHKSCRGIIRNALKELKEAGFVEEHRNGGCQITQEGQKALDTIAVSVRYPEEDD